MSRHLVESGVDWIGKVPEDWEIHNLKHMLIERKEVNNPITVTEILSLTNNRGVIPYSEKGEVGNKSKEDISSYKIVRENDIVINSMNLYIGSVGLSKYEGALSPVYYTLYNRNPLNSIEYFNFLFQTKELQSKSHGFGNGILDIRMRIPMSNLNRFPLPVPPSEEQHLIVKELNKKSDQIDKLIAIQEQQIDKLNEYKQTVISRIITKGLNSNVQKKDSGIEWIGKIPSHWEINKVKYLGVARNGLTYSPDELTDSDKGILVLRSSNVQNGKIDLNDSVYVSKDIPNDLMVNYGDILICSRNGSRDLIGKNAIIPEKLNASFGAFMMLFRPNISSRYFYYVLNSAIFNYYLGSYLTSTINQLTLKNFNTMEIVYTKNINEQNKIVEYLDLFALKIDKQIEIKKQKIEKLKEYKKSLIYEYVTGKKQVKH